MVTGFKHQQSYLGKAANVRGGEEETEEVGDAVSPNRAHLRMKGTGASRKRRDSSRGGRRCLYQLGSAARSSSWHTVKAGQHLKRT